MSVGKSGPVIVVILALVPVLFWIPWMRTASTTQILLGLGQVSALVGYTLFCMNFVLSTRIGFLEIFFSGLPRVYIWHHLFGVGAFVLLLFHPVFLALSYLSISLQVAINQLWPSIDKLPILVGSAALSVMILLLVLTLFVKLEYDFWKKTHQYLGLPLILAGIHVFFVGSTVALSEGLRIYLLALTGTAIVSYLYKTLLGRWLVPKRKYAVSSLRKLNSQIFEIGLKPTGKQVKFAPGQFVFITPTSGNIPKQSHPFSLTSNPGDEEMTTGIKIIKGGYTEKLRNIDIGTQFTVEGAYGRFSYKYYPYQKQVWVAGGIGITPFVSMAKSLDVGGGLEVTLIYSVKDKSDAVYLDQLRNVQNNYSYFHLVLHETSKSGRLDSKIMTDYVPDLKEREIFVCGPGEMMKSLRINLKKMGIQNSRIHSEEFSLN